jgi:hypothetical protein
LSRRAQVAFLQDGNDVAGDISVVQWFDHEGLGGGTKPQEAVTQGKNEVADWLDVQIKHLYNTATAVR